MPKEIDMKFYNAYPVLYALASGMKISKEEIDNVMDKIWGDWRLNQKYNKLESELIVRAILARLNQMNQNLNDLYQYKDLSDEKLHSIFGIRQLEIVKAILQ